MVITGLIMVVTAVGKAGNVMREEQVGRCKQFYSIRDLGLGNGSMVIHYIVINEYH